VGRKNRNARTEISQWKVGFLLRTVSRY
jgi:hypothetical protein